MLSFVPSLTAFLPQALIPHRNVAPFLSHARVCGPCLAMEQVEVMEGLLAGVKSMLAQGAETEEEPMLGQEV